MVKYFSKDKISGKVASKIEHQDSVAAIHVVEQLKNYDIFKFGIKIENFNIKCGGCDDLEIIDINNNRIFIQVKSSKISKKRVL